MRIRPAPLAHGSAKSPPGGARGGWVLGAIFAVIVAWAPPALADECIDGCDDYYQACSVWAWHEFTRAVAILGVAEARVFYNRNRRACFANAKQCALWCEQGGVTMASHPLGDIIRIEAEGRWPDAIHDYREALLSLAAQLADRESLPAGHGTFAAWLEAELAPTIRGGRTEAEAEVRADVWAELISDVPALVSRLRVAADRLKPGTRPNLASLFRAALVWNSNDRFETQHVRHVRHRPVVEATLGCGRPDCWVQARRATAALLVQQLVAAFPDDTDLLAGLLAGETITEIARSTGRSRQHLYRRLDHLREWLEAAA